MVSFSEEGGFKEMGESAFILSSSEETRKKTNSVLRISRTQGQGADNRNLNRKAGLSDDSPPIRKKKVKEAKRKKQNGDYDSQEVYKKIADKLMDLFRI